MDRTISNNTTYDTADTVSVSLEKLTDYNAADTVRHSLMRDFIPFDNTATKWILATIGSVQGIRRLALNWRTNLQRLQTYYEIPDNPCVLHTSVTTPAFNKLFSLYLNPLGIAIYTNNTNALKFIIAHNINGLNDPFFLQKWWNKGNDLYLTDFSALHVITLVIRKSYFNLIPIMMEAGYKPNDRIYQLEHLQSANECKTRIYRDSLDLALQLMHELPTVNVGLFFQAICDRRSENKFNPGIFELDKLVIENKTEIWRLRSLFRLILMQAKLRGNEKFLSKYLVILHKIQQGGFFRVICREFLDENEKFYSDHQSICENRFKNATELETEKVSLTSLIHWSNSLKLKVKELVRLDVTLSVAMLIEWVVKTECRRGVLNKVCHLLENLLKDWGKYEWFVKDAKDSDVYKLLNHECCGVQCLYAGELDSVRRKMPRGFLKKVISKQKCHPEPSGDISITSLKQRIYLASQSFKQPDIMPLSESSMTIQSLFNAKMCPPPLTIRTHAINDNITTPT